jgi:hypothetical protein
MITLKTLPQATAQEVFDQVATHLLTQMKKSENDVACLYRSSEGLKCAAGCLISDDEYTPEFDLDSDGNYGMGWQSLIDRGLVPLAHRKLISALQEVHDGADTFYWRSSLARVADQYGLSTELVKPQV